MLFCGHAFLRIVNTKDFFCKTSWEFLRTPFFLLRKFPTFLQFYKRICENLPFPAVPARQGPCAGTKGQPSGMPRDATSKKMALKKFDMCFEKRTVSSPSGSRQEERASWKRLAFRAAEVVTATKKTFLDSLGQRKTGIVPESEHWQKPWRFLFHPQTAFAFLRKMEFKHVTSQKDSMRYTCVRRRACRSLGSTRSSFARRKGTCS